MSPVLVPYRTFSADKTTSSCDKRGPINKCSFPQSAKFQIVSSNYRQSLQQRLPNLAYISNPRLHSSSASLTGHLSILPDGGWIHHGMRICCWQRCLRCYRRQMFSFGQSRNASTQDCFPIAPSSCSGEPGTRQVPFAAESCLTSYTAPSSVHHSILSTSLPLSDHHQHQPSAFALLTSRYVSIQTMHIVYYLQSSHVASVLYCDSFGTVSVSNSAKAHRASDAWQLHFRLAMTAAFFRRGVPDCRMGPVIEMCVSFPPFGNSCRGRTSSCICRAEQKEAIRTSGDQDESTRAAMAELLKTSISKVRAPCAPILAAKYWQA